MHNCQPVPTPPSARRPSPPNALRPGLTARNAVIPGENQAEYEAFRAELIDCYAPADARERELVDRIIDGAWRLRRADCFKIASFDERLNLFLRDRKSIENAYRTRQRELEKLQREREKEEREGALEQAYRASLERRAAKTAKRQPSQSQHPQRRRPRLALLRKMMQPERMRWANGAGCRTHRKDRTLHRGNRTVLVRGR